jgi:N,N-dimethylformamidase
MRLLGYVDRLNAAPGDTLRFMVSCDHPEYESRLVRLVHGDVNPDGPGFRQVEIDSPIDGRRPGRHQAVRSGSYVRVPLPAGLGGPVTFATFLYPTKPGDGPQAIATQGDPSANGGWSFGLSEAGEIELVIGSPGDAPARLATGSPVHRWTWYFAGFSVDRDGRAVVWSQPVRPWPGDPPATAAASLGPMPDLTGDLILAAVPADDGATDRHLDGKLDRPRLFARALGADERARLAAQPDALDAFGNDVLGAWDFGADISTDRVTDRSRGRRHGTTVNMPTRAVTGHNYSGRERDFRQAREEYGAIHFHRDDLEDAGWEPGFELTVPDDLPSGVYAAWLRAGDDEDHIPFIVRPPRSTARSRVAVLMPTLTYVVYANFTDLGPGAWREGAAGNWRWSPDTPNADPTLFREVYRYIDENALYGTYDLHVDGSGVCYGSPFRPILNMRPKFRYRIWAAPPRFPADLYLVNWLADRGIEADFITDHDLEAEGVGLLRPYAVVLSGSHPEYWTSNMLDGLDAYLGDGGRFMYLGGNGLFGVASFDPHKPYKVEVRRWGAPWPFEVQPGERHHSTTGEGGGTWRNRGRPPNERVGVGTSAAGFDRAVPYKRMPGSFDPRVRFIFEGIGDDELIGDHPSIQTKWGAAGYEIDRFEPELGSPATTILLASSVGFSDAYKPMVDDVLWYIPGREGKHPDDPQVEGEPHRFVRSDMVYLEYPNGGAVFSVGSIAWLGSISYNGGDNTVSRVTENVVRRFADRPRGESPGD